MYIYFLKKVNKRNNRGGWGKDVEMSGRINFVIYYKN